MAKKTAAVLMALMLLALLPALSPTGQDPVPGLKGSKHDFTDEAWTGGDLCVACHAQAPEQLPEAPLWGPSQSFNEAFGEAINAPPGERPRLPGAGSMICMRCHDGALASDMFGGLSAPAAVNHRHPAVMTAGHATNHPVGVAYPQHDRGFHPMHAVVSEGMVRLPDGRVECISCHDPHNQAGARFMLTKSNARSALCLTCHNK